MDIGRHGNISPREQSEQHSILDGPARNADVPARRVHKKDRQRHIERLAQSQRDTWAQRERQKQLSEQAEVKAFGFEPRLSQDSVRQAVQARKGGDKGAAFLRLHTEADNRIATRQRLRRELEAQTMQQLKFEPQINSAEETVRHRHNDMHSALLTVSLCCRLVSADD